MSAQTIYDALDKERYVVELCAIDRSGVWYSVDDVREPRPGDEQIMADLGTGNFVCQKTTRTIRPDVVFPILHGKLGEDGTIQGLLEIINLPYVGCDVEASALCMDKIKTKQLLQLAGIDVVASVDCSKYDDTEQIVEATSQQLGSGPWFVKPSRAGSSVGVSKVSDANDLPRAISEALKHDAEVLVEAAVNKPHEVEVAVLGNLPQLTASEPGEIVPGEEFYTYDDKYSPDTKSYAVFSLPEEIADLGNTISDIAKHAYGVLGCSGLARVDFLVSHDKKIYLNEVNTMPGFTKNSMYPKLMEKGGLSYTALVDKLIALALEKYGIVKE